MSQEVVRDSLGRLFLDCWLPGPDSGVRSQPLRPALRLAFPKCHSQRTPSAPFGHGSKPMLPFWDRCTTHFVYFSGWIGMFTGGTAHGHLWPHLGSQCLRLAPGYVPLNRLRSPAPCGAFQKLVRVTLAGPFFSSSSSSSSSRKTQSFLVALKGDQRETCHFEACPLL